MFSPVIADRALQPDAAGRIDRLADALVTGPTATAALARWCDARDLGAGPIAAERRASRRAIRGTAILEQLAPTGGEALAFRRVRLLRGPLVLALARTWYRPDLLPPGARTLLDATDTPFGKAVEACRPRRVTLAVRKLYPRAPTPTRPVLAIDALVLDGAGRSLALVRERYLGVLVL